MPSVPNSGGGSGGGPGPVNPTPTTPAPVDPVLPKDDDKYIFDDTAEHWARDEISFLVKEGIVTGRTEKIYSPDDAVSRAEFLSMVIRVVGEGDSEYSGAFDDVTSSDWFSSYIQTALDKGLISRDTLFRPHDHISREEMTKIIVMSYSLQKDITGIEGDISKYSDSEQVSEWAKRYMEIADALNIINGISENEIAPRQTATRAQAAVIIKRMMDALS